MSCHYFITLKKCFFLLNFGDINGLNSPFVILSLRGEGSYEDQLVILAFVILGGRGGVVELKMNDVIHFTVFLWRP